ncbi:MAG: tetratricopeptide repeat protein [Acidobacteria bacterium]|nr:tetratricopeptide repeat protein [Acidobacteriota bacterium]
MRRAFVTITSMMVLLAPLSGASPCAPEDRAATAAEGSDTSPVAAELEAIRQLMSAGKFADAESSARALLSEREAAEGPDASATADAIEQLIRALWREGKQKDPQVAALAERLVSIRETSDPPEGLKLGSSLAIVGSVRAVAGGFADARQLYERAIDVAERATSHDDPALAPFLYDLGMLLQRHSDYDGALIAFERRHEILDAQAPPEQRPIPDTYVAACHIMLGRYDEALRELERDLQVNIAVHGPDDASVARSENALGALFVSLDDWPAARDHLEHSVAIFETVYGADSVNVATGLRNLSLTLVRLGNDDEARTLAERAVAIYEKSPGPESTEYAASLSTLADALQSQGEYRAARERYEKSIAIREEANGPDDPRLASPLENLGRLYETLGDDASAMAAFRRALKLRENALGEDHPDVAYVLVEMAGLLYHQGAYAEARRLVDRALANREKTFGPLHPEMAESLSLLGWIQWASGDSTAALTTALNSEQIAREHLRRVSRRQSEREALRYQTVRSSGIDLAFSVLASQRRSEAGTEDVERAWDALISSRALVLDEMARRHRVALASESSEMRPLFDELERTQVQLERLVIKGAAPSEGESYRASLAAARLAVERAERALASRSDGGGTGEASAAVDVPQLVSALPSDTVLVAYVSFGQVAGRDTPGVPPPPRVRSYAALALGKSRGGTAMIPLGPAARIDALVKGWRKELDAPPETPESLKKYRTAGTALRKAIWDPIARAIRGAGTVLIVPDGSINLVSFAALPIGNKSYLVESTPRIHYLSAERDLVRYASRVDAVATTTARGMLILGAPDYDAGTGGPAAASGPATVASGPSGMGAERAEPPSARSACADFRTLRFGPLPGSRAEADEVASLFRTRARPPDGANGEPVIELLGADASVEKFKSHAVGRRVIHIATHAYSVSNCSGEHEDDSDRLPITSGLNARFIDEDPLIRTGLALAGANRREERSERRGRGDGILTAQEIAGMDLRGVEWAVLSACGTGVGPVQSGEGVFGLRRTVQVAGVRTVIMSLWAVEDHAARDWVRSLYENRLKDASTVDAVRNASLRVIDTRRRAGVTTHPFYWGAFVAAGDWK